MLNAPFGINGLNVIGLLSQATSEVVEPRPSRPAAGKITTAVHVNCMAGPEYEMGRTTDVQVIMNKKTNRGDIISILYS